MVKGQIAKTNVENAIKETFGENFLGTFDKKIYVQTQENGEMVQVAITLTCPKNPIAVGGSPERGQRAKMGVVEDAITDDERQTIADMMARLGL